MGTLPQVPPDLGEVQFDTSWSNCPPLYLREPHTSGSTPIHPREQPLYTSGSTPQFRKHLPSAQNSPHVSEQATVYTSGHTTPKRAHPLHLRTPHTSGDTPDSPQDTLLHLSPLRAPPRSPAVPAAKAAPHAGRGRRSPAVMRKDRQPSSSSRRVPAPLPRGRRACTG